MRKSLLFLILLLNTLSFHLNGQLKYSINESWHFLKNNSIDDVNQFLSQKEAAEIVNLPHTWNDKDVEDEVQGFYRGDGWYTREIRIPSSYKDKHVSLFFEGVNTVAEVYVNSKLAGKHIGGYTRFVVPVSDFIQFDDSNEFSTFNLVVKVNNAYDDDVPTLSADFTFYGGIYRDVYLLVSDKVHFNISDDASNGVFITTPNVSKVSADLNIRVKVKNDNSTSRKVKLLTRVYDPQLKLIREESKPLKMKANTSNEYKYKLEPFNNPQLWSPDSPSLYKVICQLFDTKTGEKLDESINPLGFRWFNFDVDSGFYLNGEHLKLIGTNRHQDYKGIGNALPDNIHVADIIKMKEMGSNFLRIAHYPQDPTVMEACDKLGILTTVEVPIVNTITETEAFSENCLSAHLEMMRQNYNHPSLIIWAYMNEVLLHPRFAKDKDRYEVYAQNVAKLAQEIEDLTRNEDPYRYTMIPNHGNLDRYYDAGLCDIPMIVGWNIYEGWYKTSYDILEDEMYKYHKAVNKPMIIAEYGAGADPRLHTLEPVRFDFTQEYATRFHEHYLGVFQKLPFIAGVNVWNYADFNSEGRTDAVQSINNKGLIGIDRKPKDVFYFYQASLLKEPFIGIATKTWNKRSCIEDIQGEGICTMPVEVFSNQDEIELFHNGQSLGSQKVDGAIALFDVPFSNGENRLRAVSHASKIVEDYSIVSINVLPVSLKDFPANGLSINVGDPRFFYDEQIDQAWVHDIMYTEGSWGYIGGKVYVKPGSTQQPYGAKQTITGTPNDPIYQTQLIGLDQYRFDVPQGQYEIKLHFAELEGTEAEHLPYDLNENSVEISKISNRIFSVIINDKTVIDKLDVLDQFGEFCAVKIKSQVIVQECEPIIIEFKKIVGEPILNAIEIYKKL